MPTPRSTGCRTGRARLMTSAGDDHGRGAQEMGHGTAGAVGLAAPAMMAGRHPGRPRARYFGARKYFSRSLSVPKTKTVDASTVRS
jgi:hypothetical protein